MKTKDYLRIDASRENHLKTLAKRRDFAEAKRLGLFDLGEELFNKGYDYNEFSADLFTCFATPKEKLNEFYEQFCTKYPGISKFPKLNVLSSISLFPNYLQAIENGYNRAKRLNDIFGERNNKKR